MKHIIALCKDRDAPEHPDYGWFEDRSGLSLNDGKPLVLRFRDRNCFPGFDFENDLPLYWYRNEKCAKDKRPIDYDYIGCCSSVTFLFDDGTTRQFKADSHTYIYNEWDEEGKPIGVYKELVEFLEDYIKNGGCESESKYMITNEVEFMDI